MTSTKTIGVRLMGGKLPGRRWRAECRTGDLEQRTRRKCSSRRWLDSSSRYFLKRSKTDISQNVKFFRHALSAAWAIRAMTSCYQPTTLAQRYAAIRQTSGLSIVNPTAMLETNGPVNCLSVEIGTRSKRNFQRPESNCGVAINSASEVFMLIISSIGKPAFQIELRIFPARDLAKTGSRAGSCHA